jgi:hypothetical protein
VILLFAHLLGTLGLSVHALLQHLKSQLLGSQLIAHFAQALLHGRQLKLHLGTLSSILCLLLARLLQR